MISFCSIDYESFPPQQLREVPPLSPHGGKAHSGKAEPFNPHELINPKQPPIRITATYSLHIFQALSTSSSHVKVESGLRRFGDFSVPC